MIPRPAGYGMEPPRNYPAPIVDLAAGRVRALAAFRALPRG